MIKIMQEKKMYRIFIQEDDTSYLICFPFIPENQYQILEKVRTYTDKLAVTRGHQRIEELVEHQLV